MKVSIVIPTKNEHGNITRLIAKIIKVTTRQNLNYELLVIDDNSNDGTIEDVKKLKENHKNLQLIQRQRYSFLFPRYPTNWKYLGIGSAHKIGYNLATGDIIISMDADLSHPPEKIPELLEKICNGYDICVGSRYVEGGGTDKNIINRIVSRMGSFYLSRLLGMKLNDLSTGYRAIKRNIWEKIKRHSYTNDNNFLIESLYFAQLFGAKITEIPIFFKEREVGESKTPLVKETLKALVLPLKLRYYRQK